MGRRGHTSDSLEDKAHVPCDRTWAKPTGSDSGPSRFLPGRWAQPVPSCRCISGLHPLMSLPTAATLGLVTSMSHGSQQLPKGSPHCHPLVLHQPPGAVTPKAHMRVLGHPSWNSLGPAAWQGKPGPDPRGPAQWPVTSSHTGASPRSPCAARPVVQTPARRNVCLEPSSPPPSHWATPRMTHMPRACVPERHVCPSSEHLSLYSEATLCKGGGGPQLPRVLRRRLKHSRRSQTHVMEGRKRANEGLTWEMKPQVTVIVNPTVPQKTTCCPSGAGKASLLQALSGEWHTPTPPPPGQPDLAAGGTGRGGGSGSPS